LAATKRPTSCNRIGSDGKAMRSSLSGEDFAGSAMKHLLHELKFGATVDVRRRKSLVLRRIFAL
jgi:hypothetical protein